MEKFWEKLNSEGLKFLFFLIGALIGTALVFLAYFILTLTRGKKKLPREREDITKVKDDGKSRFLSEKTGFDFKTKLTLFSDGIRSVAEGVSRLYEDDGVKICDLFGAVNLSLDFTLYELIDFLDGAVGAVENELEATLSSGSFKAMFFAYRVFDKKMGKDPTEVKLSYIFAVLTEEKEEPTTFWGKLVGKAKKKVVNVAVKAVKPSVVKLVDGFFVRSIEAIAEEINGLYSHNVAPTEYADRSTKIGGEGAA